MKLWNLYFPSNNFSCIVISVKFSFVYQKFKSKQIVIYFFNSHVNKQTIQFRHSFSCTGWYFK